jgi:hypothetical protein
MNTVLKGAGALALLAVTFAFIQLGRLAAAAGAAVDEMPVMLNSAIAVQGEEFRALMAGELSETRGAVLRRVDGLSDLIDRHAAAIEGSAVSEIQTTRRDLIAEIHPISGGAVDLLLAYQQVPAQVGARLDPWTDCHGNGACWQSQITATLGATRATFGQVAKAAPSVASSFERSALATEQTTAATAKAMNNLAELTRPLPRWLRVPMQVIGPTAPLWLPFIGR